MPATSASSRRETEKKRAAKTALPPWRAKSPSTLLQALWGELYIPSPLQDERASRFVADPVTDLVPDDGPKDAKQYGVPEVQVTLLNQYAGGQEYGRARERDARGPEHHAKEDDQVSVVLDQGVKFSMASKYRAGSRFRAPLSTVAHELNIREPYQG